MGGAPDALAVTERDTVPASLQFLPLTDSLVAACHDFNARLRDAGAEHVAHFGCDSNPPGAAASPAPMQLERYVAVDQHGAIRGGYALRWQFLWLRGERLLAAHYGFPVAEGVIDKRYAMVGASVLRDAMKRCPYLYTLGADGRTGSVFGMGRHIGWAIEDIPFLFRVVNGRRFLRRLPQVQRHVAARAAATVLGATGVADLSVALLHACAAIRNRGSASLRAASAIKTAETGTLAEIADEVWSRVCRQYEFCVVRDRPHVEAAFPQDRPQLHRLSVRRQGSIVGWAVVMKEGLSRLRAYLGDVAPGLIVDCFGDMTYAGDIVRAATAYLADQGVDVVITNASHRTWVAEYRRAGFIERPSQFPLIVSRPLAAQIGDLHAALPTSHLSRGDGDGVHYLH